MSQKQAYLKIKRQASPKDKPYWYTFALNHDPDDTILALLIQLETPAQGSTPVYHECNCMEEVCGTCSLLVNGEPKLACSTLIKDLPQSSSKNPIVLEPLSKFPVIRDLAVDKSRISRTLDRVTNWVETDQLFGSGIGYEQNVRHEIYSYSKCIDCGSCYEACPRTGENERRYIGPAAIAHAVAMNDHPLGKESKNKRLTAVMGNDGVSKCGKSKVCETVCPKKVPLVRSVTRANRESILKLFGK